MRGQTAEPGGGAQTFYRNVGNTMAGFYDRGLGPVFFADFADDIARRAAASAPLHVLERAAGTGIVTRRLRDLLPVAAQLTASDLNPGMLAVARAKFSDAVVCQFGVMFFPDKEAGFRAAHRVLAAGGRYLFSVWDAQRHNPIGPFQSDIAARLFPADPPRFFDAPFSYHRIDPIKDGLDAAGFTDIRIAVLSRDTVIADPDGFARALVHGSPLIDEIRARGSVDPEAVVAAIMAALPAAFGTDPMRLPLQAIVVEARRR